MAGRRSTPMPTMPLWPTTVRSRSKDGRIRGTDGSVWLYRAVPMAPVADARSPEEGLVVGDPLRAVLDDISGATAVRVPRRSMAKSGYRDLHILLVNIPVRFTPPRRSQLAGYLAASFPDAAVDRRLLLLGVKLRDQIGGGDHGLSKAIDSVVQTISTGVAPLSDFDADFALIDGLMARAGLTAMTPDDYRIANAWWNHGYSPDAPLLVHTDHIHVFGSSDSARVAAALVERDGDASCGTWTFADHHTVSFGCVQDFDLPYVDEASSAAQWVSSLVEAGAVCVSIRGKLEPPQVTRSELRRRKKQAIDDETERASQNKMSRSELEERLVELDEMEGVYAIGGPPVLVEASTVVAFTGFDERSGYDMRELGLGQGVLLSTMTARQNTAMAETWLASNVRAVPYLHDIPSHTLAASGLPNLSTVGDRDGALIGFTERDRQPSYLTATASSDNDSLPIFVGAGATGSGKATELSTRIPTPTGWTTMGELCVGQTIFAGDGSRCTVREIYEHPELTLYDVHFSDGQIVRACKDHLWSVSNYGDRNRARQQHHIKAIQRWDRAQELAEQLTGLSSQFDDYVMMNRDELFRAMSTLLIPWQSPASVSCVLDQMSCASRYVHSEIQVQRKKRVTVKDDPVVVFPVVATLNACCRAWRNPGTTNAKRWRTSLRARIAAAESLIEGVDPGLETTVASIARMLTSAGATFPQSAKHWIAMTARKAGIQGRPTTRTVTIPLPDTNISHPVRRVWSAPLAFKSLAAYITEMYGTRPTTEPKSCVLSTQEMIDVGIKHNGHTTEFAVAVPGPIQCDHAELPLDPYVLGVWLGDGSSSGGQISQGRGPSSTDKDGLTDQRFIMDQLTLAGIDATPSTHSDCLINTRGLQIALRRSGVLNNKHIPVAYLRADELQRIALLQGIMDTDGTVDKRGSCELTLCNERLASDSLELIRSLGIKASMRSSPSMITEPDPDRQGRKRRRRVGTRWRIVFTTTKPVFRLPRKQRRLPADVRETQHWNYITEITPAPSAPGRCITVDSNDHTYLVEGFIPTHNTLLMQFLADQFSQQTNKHGQRRPVIIIDPKASSDLSPIVLGAGGRVASLDELTSSDGVFDPLRFTARKEVGVELAASMLMAINPWGTGKFDYETPLIKALSYGADRGADCTGIALRTALDDGQAPRDMVERVFDLAGASPMFRACVGVQAGGPRLRSSEGITLIKVGEAYLDLPEPGATDGATQQQRIALALVRMMVYGSAMALTGRQGVLMLDEAWVMLSAGRSEVERLGRLARSQEVLPMLFTQRVTDATNAGLSGYIARGIVLPIEDRTEAEAACELFRLEPTPERIARITAKASLGGIGSAGAGAPNWSSMRALRDSTTGRVLRGAVGIYVDLSGRAVPVEVKVPGEFLERASTNPEDIRRRLARGLLPSQSAAEESAN